MGANALSEARARINGDRRIQANTISVLMTYFSPMGNVGDCFPHSGCYFSGTVPASQLTFLAYSTELTMDSVLTPPGAGGVDASFNLTLHADGTPDPFVAAAVPEPSTRFLLIIGLGTVAYIAFRRYSALD